MSFHSISFRSTKIVATLGPLSDIRSFVQNGVDVFRINASHGTHQQYKIMVETIRSLEKEFERPLPILFDLQGPKLRIGHFSEPEISLEKNNFFTLDLDMSLGDKTRVCFPHPEFYSILSSGSFLLLNDGKIHLEVLETNPTFIKTRVIIGGLLSSCKGVNIPSTFIPINTLTEKDHTDLLFALDHGIDFIGLSFVQTKEDVIRIRNIVGDRAQLLSKIEKPSAIENLNEIIDVSDGIMVARGDLGVELPIEKVPFLQKIILKEARKKGKPVIVATQMLESMILSASPTRAEVSDVATAVMDGADAVCLSAESATGHYPLEAISMMDRIIRSQEKHKIFYEDQSVECTADAMAISAKQLSKSLNLPLIVTLSEKGFTTLRMARQRPSSKIISLSSSLPTVRHMSLVWGTKCFLVSEMKNRSQDITNFIQDKLKEKNNMLVFSRFQEDLENKDQEFQINVVIQNTLP